MWNRGKADAVGSATGEITCHLLDYTNGHRVNAGGMNLNGFRIGKAILFIVVAPVRAHNVMM
jgi:hypothetical protein